MGRPDAAYEINKLRFFVHQYATILFWRSDLRCPVQVGSLQPSRRNLLKWFRGLYFTPSQALFSKSGHEFVDMLFRIGRHTFYLFAQLEQDVLHGVISVEEFPYEHSDRVQTKAVTSIAVEEHGPVVKLLPEHDMWAD